MRLFRTRCSAFSATALVSDDDLSTVEVNWQRLLVRNGRKRETTLWSTRSFLGTSKGVERLSRSEDELTQREMNFMKPSPRRCRTPRRHRCGLTQVYASRERAAAVSRRCRAFIGTWATLVHAARSWTPCSRTTTSTGRRKRAVLFEMALEVAAGPPDYQITAGQCVCWLVWGGRKQSLTRLATYCAGYDIFSIQLMRGYGEIDFARTSRQRTGVGDQRSGIFIYGHARGPRGFFWSFEQHAHDRHVVPGSLPGLGGRDGRYGLRRPVTRVHL